MGGVLVVGRHLVHHKSWPHDNLLVAVVHWIHRELAHLQAVHVQILVFGRRGRGQLASVHGENHMCILGCELIGWHHSEGTSVGGAGLGHLWELMFGHLEVCHWRHGAAEWLLMGLLHQGLWHGSGRC